MRDWLHEIWCRVWPWTFVRREEIEAMWNRCEEQVRLYWDISNENLDLKAELADLKRPKPALPRTKPRRGRVR